MMITLYKEDSKKKLHYYTIHDRQASLLSQYTLTVTIQVGDGKSRELHYTFETSKEKDAKIRELFRKRIKSGYTLLYSYDRNEGKTTKMIDSEQKKVRHA